MRRVYFEPDLRLYNLMLSVCAKSKDYKKMIQYFEEMKKDNINPDGRTFSNNI